jgi:2-polyprenyl-6-hydroxyphenyl methylase/3-demethylubiquinone-9 3-methyltransferase
MAQRSDRHELSVHGQVYEWRNVKPPQSHSYLLPKLEALVASRNWPKGSRALDFGCGNGSLTNWLSSNGFNAVGVDISTSGIATAKETYPSLTFSTDVSAESIARMGPYDLAICIEVIAHCFNPAAEIKKLFDNLKPGGTLILATPYYGYLKTLALAATGKLGEHLSVASSAAYVNLFTIPSIKDLLVKHGFVDIVVSRVGRVAPLAKAMLVVSRKP